MNKIQVNKILYKHRNKPKKIQQHRMIGKLICELCGSINYRPDPNLKTYWCCNRPMKLLNINLM